MQAGFSCNCWIRDFMTLSLQNAHGIDLRILAGSGSGMDVCATERTLSFFYREKIVGTLIYAKTWLEILEQYKDTGRTFQWVGPISSPVGTAR
jgi:hypothetical protein